MNYPKLRKPRAAGEPSAELIHTSQSRHQDSRQALLYSCTSLSDSQKVDQKNATSQTICWRAHSCRDQLCTAQGKGERRCTVALTNAFVIFNWDYSFSPFHFPCSG